MDGFDISSARIATAATNVEDVGASLNTEINTMRDLLADLSTGWQSSSAAPRFMTAMDGYLDDAAKLATALITHSEALTATGRSFEQTEQALADGVPAVTA